MLVPNQNTLEKTCFRAVAWGHNTNEIQKETYTSLQTHVTNTKKVSKKTAGTKQNVTGASKRHTEDDKR